MAKEVFNGDLQTLDYEQVQGATLINKLHFGNDGKTLGLVEGEDGVYVRRSYRGDALDEMTHGGWKPFLEVWELYNEMLKNAGLETVDSVFVDDSPSDNPVIVSRYLPGVNPEEDITIKLEGGKKVQLLGNLGLLLTAHSEILPDSQGFLSDAFTVDSLTGDPILVDVDPYVKDKNSSFGRRFNRAVNDAVMGAFLQRMYWNVEEWSNNDQELIAMAQEIVRTSGLALEEDTTMTLIDPFSNLHLLAHGLHRSRGDIAKD